MPSSRKRILVTASWYPTKENPISGTFFKEQCELLSHEYDVTVVMLNPATTLGIKYLGKRITGKDIYLEKLGDSEYFHEYKSVISRPVELAVMNNMYSRMTIKKKALAGIGSVDTEADRKFWRKHIARLARKLGEKFDLVYGISAQGTAVYAKLLADYYNVPYILSEHSPFMIPGTSLNDSFKEAVEGASVFLAISNDKIRQVLMQNIHLKSIEYIGNIIDVDKFKCEPVPHDVTTFLIVAAHSFYKNYDLFLQTMEDLKKIATRPFRIIIAGYGANKGYSLGVDEFVKQVNDSSISDIVEMIPQVSRDEITSLYNRADAFVMTSIQEGQPVAPLEAACCGLPIFSTRCGGVEDYVDDSVGRLVGILDHEELASHLNDYLEGKITFDKDHIREVITSRYGKKVFVEKFMRIVDEVTGA
ncbi:MAG: glycosyltransferase [Clostridiales bacterium]|nr:glycosyltransferase [Clostridiales bacterium]